MVDRRRKNDPKQNYRFLGSGPLTFELSGGAFSLRVAGGRDDVGLNPPGDLAHTKALADCASGDIRRFAKD